MNFPKAAISHPILKLSQMVATFSKIDYLGQDAFVLFNNFKIS